MSKGGYRQELVDHLVAYKRAVLGDIERGRFAYRGQVLEMEHILPLDQKWLTVPADYREQIQRYQREKGIHLHRYFHHLNSSQAFALGLFVPYFEGGSAMSGALLRALGQTGRLLSWTAEEIPNPDEGTNIDATWITNDGSRTICEVKLSEQDFGTGEIKSARRKKLSDIYAPTLRGLIADELLDPAKFFGSYQILRNVWHLAQAPRNTLMFLFPERNERLAPLLDRVLSKVAPEIRARISVRSVESVLDHLVGDLESPEESRRYGAVLARKFIPGRV